MQIHLDRTVLVSLIRHSHQYPPHTHTTVLYACHIDVHTFFLFFFYTLQSSFLLPQSTMLFFVCFAFFHLIFTSSLHISHSWTLTLLFYFLFFHYFSFYSRIFPSFFPYQYFTHYPTHSNLTYVFLLILLRLSHLSCFCLTIFSLISPSLTTQTKGETIR